ncbi:hypothetical protein V5O48_016699 [Marasmius crinis-equi]|uniref:Uncharacterized protein n=1 Tax=Marasmius crinis-equi TaxID=585013 RepID=A0ABR3ER09_9AGAR
MSSSRHRMDPEEFYLAKSSSREGEGPTEKSRSRSKHEEPAFMLRPHPEVCMVECIHRKGPCSAPFEHVALAAVRKLPEFLDVKEAFEDHFQSELKKTIVRLQKRIGELEAKLVKQQNTRTSSKPGPSSKRKQADDSSSQMEVDSAPPAKRVTTSRSNPSVPDTTSRGVVPHIDFHIIDAEARPHQVDLTLVSFANHRASIPVPETNIMWDRRTGRMIPPVYIRNHDRNGTVPTPMTFSGQPSGLQTFPHTSQELFQLIADAQIPGNFIPAVRVLLMRSVAATLDHLHRIAPEQVPAPSGVVFDCLTASVYPDWLRFTVFIDVQRIMKPDDSSQIWTTLPALLIPLIASDPPSGSTDEELAQGTFVHYSHTAHCGILHTNSGHTFIPNLRGHRFLLDFSPAGGDSNEAKSLMSQYKFVCITLMASAGLYEDIVAADNLTIAPSRQVSTPVKTDVGDARAFARHLARSGVTIAEMNDYVIYGMVYCQHIWRLTYFSDFIRRRYAQIFITAQYRLLFYPVSSPSSSTYQFPQHWNLEHIQEYRRRQAIIRRWRDTNDTRLESPDYQFPLIQQNPNSSTESSDATQAVEAMNVDNDNTQPSQPAPESSQT